MHWTYNRIQGGGEKWSLYSDECGLRTTHATVIRLPGSLTRIYWLGGRMADYYGPEQAANAIQACWPAADRMPNSNASPGFWEGELTRLDATA